MAMTSKCSRRIAVLPVTANYCRRCGMKMLLTPATMPAPQQPPQIFPNVAGQQVAAMQERMIAMQERMRAASDDDAADVSRSDTARQSALERRHNDARHNPARGSLTRPRALEAS